MRDQDKKILRGKKARGSIASSLKPALEYVIIVKLLLFKDYVSNFYRVIYNSSLSLCAWHFS